MPGNCMRGADDRTSFINVCRPVRSVPMSMKECNIDYVDKRCLRLIKFPVNTIYIYDSKLIYYKNIFYN
jgi:hypothetical protein